MISSLIFDFNGIVVTDGTERLYKILSSKYDQDLVYKLLYGKLGDDYRKGLTNEKEFWSKIRNRLHAIENPQQLQKEWYSGFIPIDKNIKLIKNIHSVKKYYMTNSSVDLVKYIKHNNGNLYNDLFDSGVFSFQYVNLGLTKMDVQLYNIVLKRWELSPTETAFIDHDLRKLTVPESLVYKLFSTQIQMIYISKL